MHEINKTASNNNNACQTLEALIKGYKELESVN